MVFFYVDLTDNFCSDFEFCLALQHGVVLPQLKITKNTRTNPHQYQSMAKLQS